MASELISQKTRIEFREHLTTTSLAKIRDAFESAGIRCDSEYEPPVGGQRRALVEQYYRTVDWNEWSSVEPILRMYEAILIGLELDAEQGGLEAQYAAKKLPELIRWLKRDGVRYEDGRLLPPITARLPSVRRAATALDAPEIHSQIDRMTRAVDHDPALAVGTAKELIESTCKSILTVRGVAFDDTADLGELVKLTRMILKLLPEDISRESRGADTIKRLLSSLSTVAGSLAELRNLYGTGHGRGPKSGGIEPRHARLAIGAAATLVTFLFETHMQRRM